MNISPATRIFELFDSESDFAERDFSSEKQFARLSGDKLNDGTGRFRSAELRYDVGIEEPAPHSPTSLTLDLMVIRSKSTSAKGDVAKAATISRPAIGRRMRSNSSARTTTTASRPCNVTRCGPRCWAWRTTSLRRAFAS